MSADNILHTYFEGLTKQILAEIEYMNKVITHMGEKGRANERVIRDMLIKFLPKRYAIGSGVLIDRKGGNSRQCDIIIYDNEYNPEFFSQRSIALFPVDIVYATIEVKTSLNQSEIKKAIRNIKSVKKLEYIEDKINISGSKAVGPQSPIGVIFAYDSNIIQPETIKSNFIDNLPRKLKYQPDLGLVLKKGMLFYKKASKYDLNYLIYSGKKEINNDNKLENIEILPAKAFLKFLSILYEKLKNKHIRKEELFSQYLGKEYFKKIEIIL